MNEAVRREDNNVVEGIENREVRREWLGGIGEGKYEEVEMK